MLANKHILRKFTFVLFLNFYKHDNFTRTIIHSDDSAPQRSNVDCSDRHFLEKVNFKYYKKYIVTSQSTKVMIKRLGIIFGR